MNRVTPSRPGLPRHRNRPGRPRALVAQVSMLAGQTILLATLALAPWFFGGVQARARVWLFGGVLAAMACWLISRLAAQAREAALPIAVVPLVGAIGLGLVQLVPCNASTVALLSPAGAELRDSLLPTETAEKSADASLAATIGIRAGSGRRPLSLYPASTRRDLAMLILAVAVFVLGAALFRTCRAQLWLCGIVAVNGAALAFFGLVQRLTWNGLLYWTVPLTQGGSPFGPFVNRNHGAAYLNLCLACAVAVMVCGASGHRSHPGESGVLGLPRWRFSLAGPWQRFLAAVARLNGRSIALLGLTGCIVGGILCSLSRGAGIAMVGATILTIVVTLCARGRALRGWSIGLAAAAGVGLVGWVGMSDAVQARFATLLDAKVVTHTRIPHWRDGLKAAHDFWPSGSGLGTYRYVYRPYQERPSDVWYHHAENQYLEALVEGGVVGLALMLAMIGLVGAAAWRLVRDDSDTRSFAFGIAGMFALASQAIHGFFDFALYIPANMVLFALLCGAVSGRATGLAKGLPDDSSSPTPLPASWARRVGLVHAGRLWWALAVGLLAACLWGLAETRSVAAVEGALKEVRFTQPPEKVSPAALAQAIDRLGEALGKREDDAEAQRRMATLWLYLYRARAYEYLRKQLGVTGNDPRLWEATSQIVLHSRAEQLARKGLMDQWNALRNEPIVKDQLLPSLRHLALARRACPLIAEVHVTLGELCAVLVDPAADAVHIERSRRLGPSNPTLLFRCGFLDLQAGRTDAACESWRRSLALSDRHLDDILRLGHAQLGPQQTVEKVLPDSPALLVELARERYAAEEDASMRHMLARRAQRLVEGADLAEEDRYHLRSAASALQGRYPEAIADLSRAVELSPESTTWRYELAVLLEDQGRLSEAHEQAKLCARMDPANGKYRDLLKAINRTRLTAPPDGE